MKTLFVNACVLTMNSQRTIWENGAVYIDGETIADVGDSSRLMDAYPEAERFDCHGDLIFPGLIEPLAEAGTGLLGKQLADQPQAWQKQRERFLSEASKDELALDAELLSAKAAFLGITTLGVVYRESLSRDRASFHADAAGSQGLRLLPFRELAGCSGISPEPGFLYLDGILDRIRPEETKQLLEAAGGTPVLQITPHRLSGLTELLAGSAGNTRSPVFTGCHGISFPQLRAMAKAGIRMIYSPDTHLPTPHVVEMLHEGIPVALSSHASHNRYPLDLLQTARRAQLYNITAFDDYHILPFGKTLEMLTIESARVLGIDSVTGSIEKGKSADLCVFSWHQPHMTPNFMPLQGAMSRGSGRDFTTVIARGRPVKLRGTPVHPAPKEIPESVRRRWRTHEA